MDAGACSCPERFQLDGRLIHPLQSLETEELFLVKSLLVFEHEIGGTPQLVGKDRGGMGSKLHYTLYLYVKLWGLT